MKKPERLMEILRQRQGFEEKDTLIDDELQSMPPKVAFSELCAWHLGDHEYSELIMQWIEDCGLEVKERS